MCLSGKSKHAFIAKKNYMNQKGRWHAINYIIIEDALDAMTSIECPIHPIQWRINERCRMPVSSLVFSRLTFHRIILFLNCLEATMIRDREVIILQLRSYQTRSARSGRHLIETIDEIRNRPCLALLLPKQLAVWIGNFSTGRGQNVNPFNSSSLSMGLRVETIFLVDKRNKRNLLSPFAVLYLVDLIILSPVRGYYDRSRYFYPLPCPG